MKIPRSTAGRAMLAYRVVSRIFENCRVTFVVIWSLAMLRILVAMASVFDAALFRRAKRRAIWRPIVIASVPRTGSTLLHRFLVENGVGTGVPLWRMLVPSPSLQAFIRPLLPYLERKRSLHARSSDIHQTGLRHIETDDAALYFRFNDGFFYYAFYLAFAEDEVQSSVAQRLLDTSERDFDWLESFWAANQTRSGGERIVAKMPSLGIRLPEFLSRFPHAQIIYLVRDPIEVIPSTLSLVTDVLERRYGFWGREAIRRRYIRRLYEAIVELLRRFHADWAGGRIDRKRVLIVRYERMMHDFEGVMMDILRFVEAPSNATFEEAIAAQAEKQRRHVSRHVYSLSRLGLTETQIRRDCEFFYDAFLDAADGESAATIVDGDEAP